MKALVTYTDTGRVTSVGIANPELGDDLVPQAGEFVVAVDVAEVVKGAKGLTFATDEASLKRLRELVHTIAEQYDVDPATRRLLPKKGS